MERQEYISSVIYEGLLYGSGLAIAPFLLDDLSSSPQSTHYGYMISLATLAGCYHLGAFVGKFFSYGFKNCLGYYNTHFVDFFCLLALVIFGFSANIQWLFIGRIGVGFMAGIQGKVSSVSALLFTDYASYELSVALSTILYSLLYWSTVDNLLPNSEHDIPMSHYFMVHPAALGTLGCLSVILLSYIIYFIRKHCSGGADKSGYVVISEITDLDRSCGRSMSRSYRHDSDADDQSSLNTSQLEAQENSALLEIFNNVPNRYIRGCKGDMAEARRRWHLTLDWRREDDVDQILREPQPNFFNIKECYPHYFHNRSKDGHPVYYERVGHVDKKKMKAYGITVPMLIRHYIFITEYLWRELDKDEDNGASISIMDVDNVGMRDLMGETMEFLSQSSKIIQGHYVERCHKIFVVNAPFLFNAVWRAVQPMVHENTRKKIFILGSDRSEILKYIDASQVPTEYGGTGSPLGSSKEEVDLAAFVKAIDPVQQKRPFVSLRGQSVPMPAGGSTTDSHSESPLPSSTASSLHRHEGSGTPSSFKDGGGYMNYFGSTFSTVVSTLKTNVTSILTRVESSEAFLGMKNDYVYDENSNAWVLQPGESPTNALDDSPVFDPRDARGGMNLSRETSASSVNDPLLNCHGQSIRPGLLSKRGSKQEVTSSAIVSLLSKHRQEAGPQPWEFTSLCVILLIFHATLVFVLELIPVWLYLSNEYGGWNFSVANVGLVFAVSGFIAASGLYLAGYPKHIVYTPVCTYDSGTEIATVQLQEMDRFRESRSMSASPYPSNRNRNSSSGHQPSSLLNSRRGISNVSLQSLFWLGMVSQFFSLLCMVILLPIFFQDVPAWPSPLNLLFHVVLCAIVSSTIFSMAAVYECFIVTKKASALTGSQDMKLTFCISVSSIIGSFMGPVVLYLVNVPNSYSPADVGTQAFAIAEIAVFVICFFCYIRPPKYPLYFYA